MSQHPDRTAATGTALAVGSITSVQFGAALASTLFPLIGPLGTVSLRLLGAAITLTAVLPLVRSRDHQGFTSRLENSERMDGESVDGESLAETPRRSGGRWAAADLRAAAGFGVVFVVMNVSLYLAISRLPLATAVTIEFLGPLGVAVATASSRRQRGWALPAAAGVAVLGGSLPSGDATGILAALTAAGCWAAYILLSRRIGAGDHGLAGLWAAGVIGAVIMLPVGLVAAGPALLHPRTLALGLLVGVVSSAIPYSLDLLALRRLPTAVFGVLTSLNPAVGALAGLIVLGQHLPGRQLAGIALVVVASVGVSLAGRAHRADRADRADRVGPESRTGRSNRLLPGRRPGLNDRRAGSIAPDPGFPAPSAACSCPSVVGSAVLLDD